MPLGRLDIIMAADVARLRKDISTAVGIMKSGTQSMENVAKTAAMAIAGYFMFDTVKTQIKTTLDYADSLSKLAQKTGITANQLYSLDAAAKLSDVAFESLQGSLSKFNKNIGESSDGTGTAISAFKNLGISIKNQDGTLKNSFDLMSEISDKFKDMPDGASKATIAMQLFGKSGADMIPLLNSGSEALKEYLGIMDDDTVKAAEQFNDSMTKLGMASNAFYLKIIKELSPTLTILSNDFLGLADDSDELGGSLSGKLATGMKGIIAWGYGITSVFQIAGNALGTFGASASFLAEGKFKEAGIAWDMISTNFDKDIETWGAKLNNLYNANTSNQSNDPRPKRSKDNGLIDPTKEEQAQKKAQNDAEKLLTDWNSRKLDITKNIAIAEQDELAKPYILLQSKYEEDLIKYGSVLGAKSLLTSEFNAELEKLNIDTIAKVQKAQEDALQKEEQHKKQAIEHTLKIQEEQYRIQSKYINLLDDEADRAIALANIDYQRNYASIKAQLELGEINEEYYRLALEYEDKLLVKTLENYSLHGQVINGIKDDLESGFGEFFDYQSANFAKLGAFGKNIAHEVYMEFMKISVIKPLTTGLTSGLSGIFSNLSFNAQGGIYDSPSLSVYSNKVVSTPTLFAFASGGVPNMGVFGEAGSEAIMPLTRTSSGDLGVKAVGGSGGNTYINITNQSGINLDMQELSRTQKDNGDKTINIMLRALSNNPDVRSAVKAIR